jgi:hypothetical protein
MEMLLELFKRASKKSIDTKGDNQKPEIRGKRDYAMAKRN